MVIDFSGFEQAIDLLGGVEISVERPFTDYEYPIPGRENADCSQPQERTELTPTSVQELITEGKVSNEQLPKLVQEYPCRYEALQFTAGSQLMDGRTALKYVRSRHSAEEGSDFARSRRQRLLLEAVVERLFSLGQITKLPQFLQTLRAHVDTDLGAGDFAYLLPKAQELRQLPISTLPLSTKNYLWQGYSTDRQFILQPAAGIGEYAAIQDWLRSHLLKDALLNYPTIEVRASRLRKEIADELKQQLEAKKYPVFITTSTIATSSATLTVLNPRLDESTIESLQSSATVSAEYVTQRFGTTNGQKDVLIQLP
jgi:hypothetical protein